MGRLFSPWKLLVGAPLPIFACVGPQSSGVLGTSHARLQLIYDVTSVSHSSNDLSPN